METLERVTSFVEKSYSDKMAGPGGNTIIFRMSSPPKSAFISWEGYNLQERISTPDRHIQGQGRGLNERAGDALRN